MTGRELHSELLKRRDVEGGFVAGLIHLRGAACRVEFLRYDAAGAIVGYVSPAEMQRIAPDLLVALKRDGAKLKAWVVATSDPVPPPGVGSSGGPGKDDRTREGARDCECNAVRRFPISLGGRSGAPAARPDVGLQRRAAVGQTSDTAIQAVQVDFSRKRA